MFALALVGLVATTDAATSSQVVWQWDPESLVCVLRQEISASGDKIEIHRTPGNDTTGVQIIIPSHATLRDIQNARGAVSLDPGGITVTDVYQRSDPDEGHLYITAGAEDRAFMNKLAGASTLEISGEGIEPVQVKLQSVAAAVAALGECEERKMREWKIDPVSWRALKSGPKPVKPLIERINEYDYPHAAIAYSVQGDVLIRLDVSAEGKVTSCRALNPAKYRGFEYASCDEMRGARFRPAIDSEGRAVAAPYIFDVRFQMR